MASETKPVAAAAFVLGAIAALEISDVWFRRILAAIIVGGLVFILFPKKHSASREAPPKLRPHVVLAFFGIGFYGGFIQAGVGMVFLVILHHVLHLDLVRVNAYKVLIVAVYTIPALGVFVWSNNVNWTIGTVLAVGSAGGAWIGARLAMVGGERFITERSVLLLAARALFAGPSERWRLTSDDCCQLSTRSPSRGQIKGPGAR